MLVIQIALAVLQGLILWKVFSMSNNTDAVDALEAAAARLTATMNSASTLIDTLKSLPAADDVSERVNSVVGGLNAANEQLGAVIAANQPPA
jgi:ABC-type transporter Mla subunit MlaD